MSRNENPPFGRGETWGATTQSSSDGGQLEGKEWVFEDFNPLTKAYRSGQFVTCRAVRNVSGIALLPGRVAKLAPAPINSQNGGVHGGQVDGYVFNTPGAAFGTNDIAARGYPIDEYLPTAGVQANDLFWVVVKGPAGVLTDLASLNPPLNNGDIVIGQTAATSQATTAGRIISANANTASVTLQVANVQDYLGRVISGPAFTASTTGGSTIAATTNNTNATVVIDVMYH